MDWQWFIAVIAIPALGAVLWWTGRLQSRIAQTEKDLSLFMVKAAETYVTKSDLKSFGNAIDARFDRIDAKLDKLLNGRIQK